MKEIRQLYQQLVPPSLHTSLVNAMNDLFEKIRETTGMEIIFDDRNFKEAELQEHLKLAVYRIIQEQVNNILKHSGADKIHIRIATSNRRLQVVLEDNGVGFHPEKKSKGIGLRNIDNRVRFYKGQSSITSEPGLGCKLEISIPIQQEMKIAI